MKLAIRILAPAGVFLAAMAFRLVSWHSVFQREGVYPNGHDAYYHLRRIRYSIDRFPEVLRFDPLMNFPEGAQPIWSPVFDWLIAALLLPLPGIEQAAVFEHYVVWVPPLLGAATVVFVYFMGLWFHSRPVGFLAAACLAVLPAHTLYSRLGNVDHHVLVAAAASIMLAIGMQLFREPTAPPHDSRGLRMSAWLGASAAALVLVWPGALFHVGVLQVAMLVRLATTAQSDDARFWAKRFATTHLVACLGVLPMSAGNEWVIWGSFSPIVLSNFHPLYFFTAALCFGLAVLGWRLEPLAANPLSRAASAGAIGVSVVVLLLLLIPELANGVGDALSWFSKGEEFQSSVNESTPLFGGPNGRSHATMLLSGFVYIVPLALPYFAWNFRRRPEILLLLWWAAAFFVATLVQWRFANTYSIAHSLLVAFSLFALYAAIKPHLANHWRSGAAIAVACASLILSFAPALRFYGPHVENLQRAFRGDTTQPVGMLYNASLLSRAARFLRAYAPPLEPDPYSVLGPWGTGHILKYVAELPVVQDDFGDDVAPENFQRAEAYFSAENESDALVAVAPMKTRFVLVKPAGSGHSQGYSRNSMLTRLFHWKGSRGRAPDRRRARRPIEAVAPLQHHRLIYQSPPIWPEGRTPFCLLFEIVEGARLEGHSNPGAVVEASLAIHPRAGERFEYKTRTTADADGNYALRLPYSNESTSDDVRTATTYQLRAGERSASAFIPESAVLEGSLVEGPTLSD